MKKITTPIEAFHLRIQTLYDIEQKLESVLPKMAELATDTELAESFASHLVETKEQSKRLEKIFEMLDARPEKNAGEAIRGLVDEGNEMIKEADTDVLRDVVLAGVGRSVEHFEMAAYMNAIDEADSLGFDDAVQLLEMSLSEEMEAEKKLTKAFKENQKRALLEEEGGMEE